MQHFFCTYVYLFELIFALLTFGDKGVRVLAGPVVNRLLCVNFSGFKISFSKWKTFFTEFTDKLFKIEEMEYLIHHNKVEMWPALCRFPILSSAVKVNLGHKFSQFIYSFKTRTFESWTYAVLSSFFPIHNEIKNWNFWMWL